ncbi:MAG: leucyl aminopeptidase family protein [Pseudomonadota bacterium]
MPTPLHVISFDQDLDLPEGLSPTARRWAEGNKFRAKLGQVLPLPNETGGIEAVLVGWGTSEDRSKLPMAFSGVPAKLPDGEYAFGLVPDGFDKTANALAWDLGCYRFKKYKAKTEPKVTLAEARSKRAVAEREGVTLTQDLINTPAEDMGPAELAGAAASLAEAAGAKLTLIDDNAVLKREFPLIHTVGRAAASPPRLIDFVWGNPDHPKVTLVGKGVCFDTGGLNLKPGNSMGLMKKDMGGAANTLGLAHMIMSLDLPIRLRVLIPAVENAVSGSAFRPGDIFRSRKGLSVEINNTDAEGRLVLADALALADEEAPDLVLSLATLTGAARVALGPDIMPFYCDDDAAAAALSAASMTVEDPLWRMPFWPSYEKMIEPDIADLDNAPPGGFAGSITAALFLRRFVEAAGTYMHFDIYGWRPKSVGGQPKGGAAQSPRAILDYLIKRYDQN